jgi:hypothetical protein
VELIPQIKKIYTSGFLSSLKRNSTPGTSAIMPISNDVLPVATFLAIWVW